MKPKFQSLIRCMSLSSVAFVTLHSHAADVTLTGASAINGMNTNYTVTSPDALILDIAGVGGNRATDTMGAAIAKSGGNLTIDGTGTLRVTGGSGDVLGIADAAGRTVNISLGSGGLIDIQGGAFVNGGWGGGNWSANLADMNIASGAVFDVWDGGAIRVDALTGAGSVQNGSNTPSVFRSLVVGVDSGSGTFSGVIGGGTVRLGNNLISLTKEGSGMQILSGTNTYTGTTTISAGTLQIGAGGTSGTLGTGNVSIASGATLEINRSDAYGTTGGQTFSGAGTLVKNGTGNLTFNVSGPYNANQALVSSLQNLEINGGTVRTDSWAQWKSDLNLTVNGTGVFEMWNTTTSIGNLSGNGTVKNSANWSGYAGGAPYATNNLTIAAGTFSGTITDNGYGDGGTTGTTGDTRINLIKNTSGTLTLSGTNGYTGNTTVSDGTLVLADDAQLKFVVADAQDANVVTGSGTATFNGDFTIDTAGVSGTTGYIWLLVDVGSLDPASSFTSTFSVIGFDDPEDDGVWTMSDAKGDWSFDESTGELTLDVGNDYDGWVTDNGVTGGPDEDDDNDGMSNFEEYAFGLDPNGGSSVNPITSQLNKTTGKFTYTRRDTTLPDPPLAYTVWYSTDLTTWNEDTGATESVAGPVDGIETVEVTLTPALLTNPKLFIQIRAN